MFLTKCVFGYFFCMTNYPKVKMVFLPEAFAFIGDGITKGYNICDESLLDESEKHPLLNKYIKINFFVLFSDCKNKNQD